MFCVPKIVYVLILIWVKFAKFSNYRIISTEVCLRTHERKPMCIGKICCACWSEFHICKHISKVATPNYLYVLPMSLTAFVFTLFLKYKKVGGILCLFHLWQLNCTLFIYFFKYFPLLLIFWLCKSYFLYCPRFLGQNVLYLNYFFLCFNLESCYWPIMRFFNIFPHLSGLLMSLSNMLISLTWFFTSSHSSFWFL